MPSSISSRSGTSRTAAARRPAGRRLAVALMAAIGLLVGADGASAEPGPFTQVETRVGSGTRMIDGRIVVEAADGGLLLELPDQRYELVPPKAILARRPLPGGEPDDQSGIEPRELGRRVLADLPPGFELHLSRHYVVCFNTSRDYARWVTSLFERLYEAFTNYWKNAGLDVAAPNHPLIVVIFADRADYEALATRDVGAAVDRVVGYYSLASNRVTTFDLTGSDQLNRGRRRPPGRTGPEILASPEAAGLVATIVHEATHQLAFNCGLHRRMAPIPLWLSEGMATYFETPDLANPRGWKKIGMVNRPRLDRFLATAQPGWAAGIVTDDDAFRGAESAEDAYARAWALTHFLAQARQDQFAAYLRILAAKKPFAADSPERRERDFHEAFGVPPAVLEEAVHRAMARLHSRRS